MKTRKRFFAWGLSLLALCAVLAGTRLVDPPVAHARLSLSGLLSLICGSETESNCASLLVGGSVLDWLEQVESDPNPAPIRGYAIVHKSKTRNTYFGDTIEDADLIAFCPGGKKAVGGGGYIMPHSALRTITFSIPLDNGAAWRTIFQEGNFGGPWEVSVHNYAVCADVQ